MPFAYTKQDGTKDLMKPMSGTSVRDVPEILRRLEKLGFPVEEIAGTSKAPYHLATKRTARASADVLAERLRVVDAVFAEVERAVASRKFAAQREALKQELAALRVERQALAAQKYFAG